VAGKGDARSSAELAVKHDSWSKVCGQAARRLRPKVRRWRWTLREGDGQPLRLLVDLTGASLAAATSPALVASVDEEYRPRADPALTWSQHWRFRAEETRTVADQINPPWSKPASEALILAINLLRPPGQRLVRLRQ